MKRDAKWQNKKDCENKNVSDSCDKAHSLKREQVNLWLYFFAFVGSYRITKTSRNSSKIYKSFSLLLSVTEPSRKDVLNVKLRITHEGSMPTSEKDFVLLPSVANSLPRAYE